LILIGKEVKLFVLIVVEDLPNKLNFEGIIKILLFSRVSVNPVAILDRCDHIVTLVERD